eukprot:COSAG03_NODE_370_length_8522_cov_167.915232_5_plen_133_part_00
MVPTLEDQAKPTAAEDCLRIELRAGSVLLSHPALRQSAARGGDRATGRATESESGVGVRIPNYPTWFNSWLDRRYEPVWPSTFSKMPEAVRAIMPGLHAERREQVYEFARAPQMGGRPAAGASFGVLERHAL